MSKMPSIDQVRQYGFVFSGVKGWNTPEARPRLAQDAALITTPNTAIPVEFTAYIDPTVVEILLAPRNARLLFPEEKKGEWTHSYFKFRVSENVGGTEEYSDYANGVTSDVNNEWFSRDQYLFQTTITYGEFEVAMSSMAKLEIAAQKQRSAAERIDVDANKFYLKGVEGKGIYGVFNDPNLPASITARATGTGSSPLWADKTTTEIYNDILLLYSRLAEQSQGLISQTTPLVLCLSPSLNSFLGAATDFNVSVTDMLKKHFSNIRMEVFPELASLDGDQTIFLIAPEVSGQRAASLAFSEKLRTGAMIQGLSSWRQKFVSTTYGGIVYMPFCFASMTGMA